MIKSQIPDSIAGIVFEDRALLQRALTHRSYLNEHPEEALEDNERLEFLGDAVLNLIAAQYLYNRFPEFREGELTRLRAALVRREALAELAVQIGLGKHLLLGHGEEESEARHRPAILCDVFEAFVGALYLEKGYRDAKDFLEPLLRAALIRVVAERATKDSRSQLQELTQARFQATPSYKTAGEFGPDHAKEFVVDAYVSGIRFGRGRGLSKQAASKDAAAQALVRLRPANSLEEAKPLIDEETTAGEPNSDV
jgi:ribonuclease-3